MSDLVGPGELAVLVVPIDKEAPKGRLILPQQQAIRDLLDGDSCCVVVKERELRMALERLTRPPKLVVTDSQAFLKVAADTPRDVPLTSFSILYSRFKGDLLEQVRGTLAAERLRDGDRVLIAEACTHHPIGEDIGRVKIPRWLTPVGRRAAGIRHRCGARLSRGSVALSAGHPLRGVHVEPPRDALADPPLPGGRSADQQLRPDDRLLAWVSSSGHWSRFPRHWTSIARAKAVGHEVRRATGRNEVGRRIDWEYRDQRYVASGFAI